MRDTKTRQLTAMAMFAALAYIAVFLGRIPVWQFLKYEPKDVMIAIAALMLGPVPGIMISTVVSLIEMVTISSTGMIGCVMNILATVSFIAPPALLYKKKRTLGSAVLGLLWGTALMTAVMIFWNYLLTPLYMHVPRADVVKLLLPIILPFNLLKGFLNTGLTILLYKPLVVGLRKANLAPVGPAMEKLSMRKSALTALAFVVIGAALYLFIFR